MSLVLGLAVRERQITILDHVSDLALHRDAQQCEEVHDENWPKHRHIEAVEQRAEQRKQRAFRDGIPELEFGQAADERPELFVCSRRQLWTIFFSW